MASRPCACGAVFLDGDQYVEDGHVLSGMDWMCVPTMRQTTGLPGSTSGHGSANTMSSTASRIAGVRRSSASYPHPHPKETQWPTQTFQARNCPLPSATTS